MINLHQNPKEGSGRHFSIFLHFLHLSMPRGIDEETKLPLFSRFINTFLESILTAFINDSIVILLA